MDLGLWLFKNKCKKVKMAADIGAHYQTIMSIAHGNQTPTLLMAVRIVEYTNYEVDFHELLSEKDKEDYLSR